MSNNLLANFFFFFLLIVHYSYKKLRLPYGNRISILYKELVFFFINFINKNQLLNNFSVLVQSLHMFWTILQLFQIFFL